MKPTSGVGTRRPAGTFSHVFLPRNFSWGHVEQLSGFIGVADGQADGGDVFQSLKS